MRLFATRIAIVGCLTLLLSFRSAFSSLAAADPVAAGYAAMADANVAKVQLECERVEAMVRAGTLPRKALDDAHATLADAEDEAILARTLYAGIHVESLTAEEMQSMTDAAQRRFDRQQAIADARLGLVTSGLLAKNEAQPALDELEFRRHTLQLAQDHARLLNQLREMAEAEKAAEESARSRLVMVRYNGGGRFDAVMARTVREAFYRQFGREMPVSAAGQTAVHQELGFDHRGRIDVALNPDSPEGNWLRSYLERKHIPYIAFRSALAGNATGPHVHIGPASLRVRLAPPPDVRPRPLPLPVSSSGS